jgi:DNA polymerase III subunit delta'
MQFAEIIGQNDIKQHLVNSVKENRISHAQLLLGHEGFGTLPMALAYAQFINCLAPKDTDSCGECANCKKISKLAFPDLHFVFPVPATGSSKEKAISDTFYSQWVQFLSEFPYGSYQQWLDFLDSGNSQGLIRVEESREIIRKLSMKSFNADYKIMIIWFPEKMNPETANKLLKLLEEPYEKTLFLLVAESTEPMLSTIISRTQLIKLHRINEDDLYLGLKEKLTIDDEKARYLARISEGDYNRALGYHQTTADTKQNFELFTQVMRLSYSGRFIDMISLADNLSQLGREKQKNFLAYCQRMIRENLVVNQKQEKMARFTEEEKQFAQKFAMFIHPGNVELISPEFDKAFYHISRNANSKIVFLDTCIKLCGYLRLPVQ